MAARRHPLPEGNPDGSAQPRHTEHVGRRTHIEHRPERHAWHRPRRRPRRSEYRPQYIEQIERRSEHTPGATPSRSATRSSSSALKITALAAGFVMASLDSTVVNVAGANIQ